MNIQWHTYDSTILILNAVIIFLSYYNKMIIIIDMLELVTFRF